MMATLTTLRAHRRIDRLEAEMEELRHLVLLLADAAGIDLDAVVLVDRAARRLWLTRWEEFTALGLDPITGKRVAS